MMPTIHFDLRGDYYHAFHQDARDVAVVLNMTVTKVGGAEAVGVPKHMIQNAIEGLNNAGYAVKFNRRIEA